MDSNKATAYFVCNGKWPSWPVNLICNGVHGLLETYSLFCDLGYVAYMAWELEPVM